MLLFTMFFSTRFCPSQQNTAPNILENGQKKIYACLHVCSFTTQVGKGLVNIYMYLSFSCQILINQDEILLNNLNKYNSKNITQNVNRSLRENLLFAKSSIHKIRMKNAQADRKAKLSFQCTNIKKYTYFRILAFEQLTLLFPVFVMHFFQV